MANERNPGAEENEKIGRTTNDDAVNEANDDFDEDDDDGEDDEDGDEEEVETWQVSGLRPLR